MKTVVIALLFTAATVSAADVTGRWSGTLEFKEADGGTRSGPAYLILKQEGDKLTGSGGPNENEQYPIQNGKLAGDKLTFEAVTGGATMHFDLKLSEDRMEGEIKGTGNDGSTRTARISVKRVAEK